MKKDDFVRAFNAVRPDAFMKQRFMRAMEKRERRRFRLDKPEQLIAALGSAAVVCASAVAILLVLREGSGAGIIPPAVSVTTAGIAAESPIRSVAPAATMPVEAPYTEEVKLLENVNELIREPVLYNESEGNNPYETGNEIIKRFTPQNYPANIKPGLAWEMEKQVSDGDYLFDAVIGYTGPDEVLSKHLKFHAIPVLEPIHMEKVVGVHRYSRESSYVYSKFTRDELLYLADNGFTCHLVGKREKLQRPEGYPDIMDDGTAVALDRAPSGKMLIVHCTLYYSKGELPAKKRSQALQETKELLSSYGIDEYAEMNVSYVPDAGKKGETRVFCMFYDLKDTVLALAGGCDSIRKIGAGYPETSLEFYYNSYGDGFAALPEGSTKNTYRSFTWHEWPSVPIDLSPEPSPTPMPPPPAGARYTGDVSLLDNVQELILDESAFESFGGSIYQQSGEIVDQFTPQGYPIKIMPGLAREMEKHTSEANYLFDAVIGMDIREDLSACLAMHVIPIAEIKKQDKRFRTGYSYIYSKFTRDELLYLAEAGFTCHLVGRRADRTEIIGKIPASSPEASLELYFAYNGDGFATLPKGSKGFRYTEFIWYE